ncbi:hypothetical protein [Paenibacillus sp. FJAT-27812]|uniref:hypothetical protein n=1 Tax=Paenibacillus sp. FJAT-27812 TaxID=1684143 RepID=UPI0006A7AEDD|nr:hypothetical protein [Paenibacillus sp. FJAT-27812]
MRNRKLIVVEGLPGSGKTSTARYVKEILDKQNIANRLFLEGDLEHPADYDCAAFLTDEQYKELLHKHAEREQLIERHSEAQADGFIVYYGKLMKESDLFHGENFDAYDVYSLPLAKHQQLIKSKWSSFVKRAADGDEVYILECCFLQNPLTVMLARENQPQSAIASYIHELHSLIKPLNPLLIYLHQRNFKDDFSKVIAERPAEWLDFITWYYTEQGYGRSKGLKGVVGLLEALELRKTYELAILNDLPIDHLLFEKSSTDWTTIRSRISLFLQSV